MAITNPNAPKASPENPDAASAKRDPKGGEDRPGFDLGGSTGDRGPSQLPPRGPGTSPGQPGLDPAQADGFTDAGGSRQRATADGQPASAPKGSNP